MKLPGELDNASALLPVVAIRLHGLDWIPPCLTYSSDEDGRAPVTVTHKLREGAALSRTITGPSDPSADLLTPVQQQENRMDGLTRGPPMLMSVVTPDLIAGHRNLNGMASGSFRNNQVRHEVAGVGP